MKLTRSLVADYNLDDMCRHVPAFEKGILIPIGAAYGFLASNDELITHVAGQIVFLSIAVYADRVIQAAIFSLG